MISVNIEEKDSIKIECLFYEYQSILNIIQELIQRGVPEDKISFIIEEGKNKNIELEKNKKEISNLYNPFGNNKAYNYIFNFSNQTIEYEEL